MKSSAENTGSLAFEWPAPDIALLRLTRGAEMNTITLEFMAELDSSLSRMADTPPRALIVTGQDNVFCGGAFIKYFTEAASPLVGNSRAIREVYVRRIQEAFRRLRLLPCPTIAAINGHAFGGGLELALHCDFRLISRSARCGLTEVGLGAVAGAGGVQQLHRIVGRAKALEIVLLGRRMTAEEAVQAGLVTAVSEPEALESDALAFAQRFLELSPISVAESKRAIYRTEVMDMDAADEVALDAVDIAAAGPDWAEGMTAFAQKRPPDFPGLTRKDGK